MTCADNTLGIFDVIQRHSFSQLQLQYCNIRLFRKKKTCLINYFNPQIYVVAQRPILCFFHIITEMYSWFSRDQAIFFIDKEKFASLEKLISQGMMLERQECPRHQRQTPSAHYS